MPRRPATEMSVEALNAAVKTVERTGRNSKIFVGGVGGLALNVRTRHYKSGQRISASWVWRWTINGVRREYALGAWPDIPLDDARDEAWKLKRQLRDGKDPFQKRDVRRAEIKAAARTFELAADEYFNRQKKGKINERDQDVWFNDLESLAYRFIRNMPVDRIETKHIIKIAEQPHRRHGSQQVERLWDSVPERAQRCIAKVRAILQAEIAYGNRVGPNPAEWKHRLKPVLGEPTRKPKHRPSLPYSQAPDFMVCLRGRDAASGTRALELLILSALRTSEVTKATWDEFDFETAIWTVPAERMKVRKEHRVPLSQAAIDLLKDQPRFAGTNLVFPGQDLAKPLSGLLPVVKRMHNAELRAGRAGWMDPKVGEMVVVHGFRSTFRDWAAEQTDYEPGLCELALAHNVGDEVERAYRRTDMLEKRRAMMEDWAGYIS